MKIIMNYPPNIDEIKKHFKVNRNVLYTYGDTIYSPFMASIPDHLIKHEQTHIIQQAGDPEAWWAKYFADPEFRIDQEAEAYHNQLVEFLKTAKTQEKADNFLVNVGTVLSGEVYGNAISYADAVKKVTEYENKI